MAYFAVIGQAILNGGLWVLGSKMFGHGIDKSSKKWQKLTAKPQNWQMIKLNIGGTIYSTSRRTLLSSPKLSSLIHNTDFDKQNDTQYIAADQFWEELDEHEFFIDRDPSHFRYILNYIRDPTHCVLPTDPLIRKELSLEANFYELHGLVDSLNFNVSKSAVISSSLVTKEEANLLKQWLLETAIDDIDSFDLLYRASDHQFRAESFHSLCDDQGETLTIIQAENGYIFGGYTAFSWSGDEKGYSRWGRRPGFVFLLRTYGVDGNAERLQRGKWSLDTKTHYVESEVCSAQDQGPCFMDSIRILDQCDESEDNEAFIGEMFENAPKEKDTLSGIKTLKFRVQEYEVFKVNKADHQPMWKT